MDKKGPEIKKKKWKIQILKNIPFGRSLLFYIIIAG
jgi:hypothetical protein